MEIFFIILQFTISQFLRLLLLRVLLQTRIDIKSKIMKKKNTVSFDLQYLLYNLYSQRVSESLLVFLVAGIDLLFPGLLSVLYYFT